MGKPNILIFMTDHQRENDPAINPYITVGRASYGPAEAFRE